MDIVRDKFIQFIKTYISFVVSLLLCAIYLTIDLLVFNVETEAKIVIPKAVIYLFMSTIINILFRRQGLIYGNMEKSFVLTKEEYDQVVDSVDTNRLDDFCDIKNDNRKVVICKKKLKSVKLNYEKYENGDYEVISKEDKKKYSKRQLRAIKYCNNLEVELYDADYLTKDIETDKNYKARNVSQSKYMANKNTESIFIGIVTSIAFAYLSVSLAKDISWANLFYSSIKVVSWLASGVVSLVSAYTFVTITYKETLKDKIRKLKEYKIWFNNQKQD
jgi:hypothetical protein